MKGWKDLTGQKGLTSQHVSPFTDNFIFPLFSSKMLVLKSLSEGRKEFRVCVHIEWLRKSGS